MKKGANRVSAPASSRLLHPAAPGLLCTALQASQPSHPACCLCSLVSLGPRQGHGCQTSPLPELLSPAAAYLPVLPPVLLEFTALPRHTNCKGLSIIMSQSFSASSIFAAFIAVLLPFVSQLFSLLCQVFLQKYKSKALQQVTVKNNPRKQKQMKK